MNLNEASEATKSILESNWTVLRRKNYHCSELLIPIWWSGPGIGKTTAIRDLAESLKCDYFSTMVLAQRDAGEIGGLCNPDRERGVMNYLQPSWLPTEMTHPKMKRGIQYLDEWCQAPIANQNALGTLLQERYINEHKFHPNCNIVVASNDMQHRAGTSAMPSQIKDRFVHLEIEADPEILLDYMLNHGFRPEITSFLTFRPKWVYDFQPDVKAYPTPRSWERANTVLDMKMAPELEYKVLQGIVGDAAAADFAGHQRIFRELPDVNLPLTSPASAPVPTKADISHALMAALASKVSGKTIGNLMKYLKRVPQKEFVVLCMRDVLRRKRELHKHKEVTNWLQNEGSMMTTITNF